MLFSRRTIPTFFRAAGRFIRSFFDPAARHITEPYVKQIRDARCRLCPHYVEPQCSICTCVTDLKTLLATERCPDNPPRWREQTRVSTGL